MERLSKILKRTLYLSVGVAFAYYVYKGLKKKQATVEQQPYSPIIKQIRVTQDGTLTEVMHFEWDDEERCTYAHAFYYDGVGNVIREKKLEIEYLEDKIIVLETCSHAPDTPIFTTHILDPFGMVASTITRAPGGKETRLDLLLSGNELKRVVRQDSVRNLTWEAGNLTRVESTDGQFMASVTYYQKVQNHIFPDLNFLLNGLDVKMLDTYLTGTRSKNFARSLNLRKGNTQVTAQASYLCDHYDRPVQILIESTEVRKNDITRSSKEYEITYF